MKHGMEHELAKGQKMISSLKIALPKGDTLSIDVYSDKGDVIYVTQTYRKKNSPPGPGQTCAHCDGVSIGCVTCPPSHRAVVDCVHKKISCEPLTTH